jgi:hypothetical protein
VVPEKQRNEEQQVGLPTQAGRVWQPSAGALHAYLPPQLSYQNVPNVPPQLSYQNVQHMLLQRVREQAKQWAEDAAAAAAASGNK